MTASLNLIIYNQNITPTEKLNILSRLSLRNLVSLLFDTMYFDAFVIPQS